MTFSLSDDFAIPKQLWVALNFVFFQGRITVTNFASLLTYKHSKFFHSETVVQRCSVKKVFLEISQNSQENTCAIVSFF